ncbi:Hypothetical protein D9617_19g102280 [Elsinoe fawcettii]|nr:Hypothetical protein D9617_19g102280 [Elsinoe fawcettii]
MSGIPNPLEGMTFQSGWDSCMARSYCKWPVIVGIIIGSLIVLSVVWCAIKIICCGAQCCFCCASITKCLCCGCCRSSGSSRPPRDQYVSPLAHGNPYGTQKSGYVNPAAYESGFGAHNRGPSNSNAGAYSGGVGYSGQGQYRSQPPPKYATATFEEPSRGAAVNGDALPAMPSWGEARSTRVMEETSPERPGDVEMGRLNSEGSLPKFESDDYRMGRDSAHGDGPGVGAAAAVGAGAGAANAGAYGYDRQNSYGSGAGYGRQDQHYGQQHQSPYGQQDTYGGAGYGNAGDNSPYGQRQPQNHSPTYDQGHNPYGYAQNNNSAVSNPYSNQAPAPSRSPQQGYSSYNPPQRTDSPGYAAYPGQNTYQSTDALSSQGTGQGNYYGQNSDPSATGRRPVQGTWRDL